jgi:DNA-binding NtrC family response regulator
MKNPLVLVIDDSEIVCNLIESMIQNRIGVDCIHTTDPSQLSDKTLKKVDVVILDYYFGTIVESEKINGIKYMKVLKQINPSIAVIGFSGQKKISLAIEMISEGAIDYIDKNEEDFIDNIINSVKKVLEFKKSGNNIDSLNQNVSSQKGQLALGIILAALLLAAIFLV